MFGASILLIAHFIGQLSGAHVFKMIGKDERDKERVASKLLANIVYWMIIGAAMVIVMHNFGIETSSILTLLGACGFALGMALQGSLSDIASGVIISVFSMYSVGDFIEFGDTAGTVKRFNFLFTTLLMSDTGVVIVVPNRRIYDGITTNHTSLPTRSVLVTLMVSNKNRDLLRISEGIRVAVQAHDRVIAVPPVRVAVGTVSNLGTQIEVRVTIRSEDYPNAENFSYVAKLNEVARRAVIDAGGLLAETCDFAGLPVEKRPDVSSRTSRDFFGHGSDGGGGGRA